MTDTKAEVSIIVITHNRCELLEKCIQSLLSQKTDIPYEVIVVDNDSSDSTKKIVEKYGIKYLFVSHELSRRPRNQGIKIAKGNIIAYIDDDAIADSNWIQNIFETISSGKADAVGGKILSNSRGIASLAHHILEFGKFTNDNERILRNIPTVNAAYKMEIFNEEKFNEELFIGEDPDFNWRLTKKGYILKYNPKVIVYHDSSITAKKLISKKYQQGHWFFIVRRKNPDIPLQFIKNKFFLLLMLPFYVIGSFLRGLLTPYLWKKMPYSVLTIPILFICYISFWCGVYSESIKK